MTLLDDYRHLVAAGAIEADAAQAEEAARLDALVQALRRWRPKRSGLSGLFDRSTPAPKGRYICFTRPRNSSRAGGFTSTPS